MVAYPLYVLKVSALEMGAIFSIGWGIATALAQIPGGKLTDRFGEKPLILISIAISSLLLIAMSLTRTLMQYLMLFGLTCIIGNLSAPAYLSWLAASMPSTKRGTGFGATSAASGTGLVIGPLIGSLQVMILFCNFGDYISAHDAVDQGDLN